MKGAVRSILFNSFSLFLLSQTFSGVRILGGLPALLLSGTVLSILSVILKPILGILAFPLNMITFGTFTIVINAVILYVLTLFVRQFSIHAFSSPGLSFAGFAIPAFSFNTVFAFLVIALIHSGIKIALIWLTQE
ncbi:MAG: phage holin family protein [Patescibacteria group bacterium]|nr:phage holin family protein [Patescibacteria group bacterium]MDE2589450.1 phage holin family protein [Patescibacteria group bacterium]